MHIESFSESECGDPEKASKAMRDMFGPQAVDNAVRQAISTCWMMLPDGKKNVVAVEAEMRRIFERAIQSLHDDASAFEISKN